MTTLCSTDSSFKSLSKEEYRFECFSAWINIWRQFHHHRFPRGGVFVNFTHLQILTRAELCSLQSARGEWERHTIGWCGITRTRCLLACPKSLSGPADLERQLWSGAIRAPNRPGFGPNLASLSPPFFCSFDFTSGFFFFFNKSIDCLNSRSRLNHILNCKIEYNVSPIFENQCKSTRSVV